MHLKTKLSLGVGLLFILIIVLAVMGGTQVNLLSHEVRVILEDNYQSLDYTREMLVALEKGLENESNKKQFELNLDKQLHNLTEPGEKELTQALANEYQKLIQDVSDSALKSSVRLNLAAIMQLNMAAIQRKSALAEKNGQNAKVWIAVTGTLCFLIAFTLMVNLPGSIADPLKELTEKIRQISGRDYTQRVHLQGSSEFLELGDAFNLMASKLEEYEGSNLDNMLFEKKRIETLINNLHDPVIGLDENRKIIFANEEALKITGLTLQEIVGRQASVVASGNDLIRHLLEEVLQGPKNPPSKNDKTIKIYADNKESYFEKELIEISIVPTGEAKKQYIGHVILLKNITPFKELDFAKTNFIATVSHELKTPISSIKMSLQLLEDERVGSLNAEQHQLAEGIREESERLLKITGELLNLSQVETGNIQLSIQQTSVTEIIQYALETVKVQAVNKQVELEVLKDDNLPGVKADAEKTAWVLINLLSNSIRYSPEKSKVTISAKLNNENVLFSVQDRGRGIDEKYRTKIFDRYFQVPGTSKSGTGLGLSISKEFIEAQGGTIGVKSSVGEGSTFYFELPVA